MPPFILKFAVAFAAVWSFAAHAQISESVRPLLIDASKATVRTRLSPPKGFRWEHYPTESFGHYLSNFPLKPEGLPLRDYTNLPLPKQYHHAAILDIDVGEKDLQQCADAWIRLYGEYLWKQNRKNEIAFEFTSGQKLSWNEYSQGIRTTEDGERVKFHRSAKPDESYANFRKYLDLVFQYAGTISLDREAAPLTEKQTIRVGDLIVKPGSPGHSVFIVGSAINPKGKRVFLLAESYMPAQDIHILKNPIRPQLSPWYELEPQMRQLITPKFLFVPAQIKRFRNEK
ncbi:DUF4846 domain-containing protein [Bergeyella sp. RCAD1439]|uniref:DUF4846 domain-containing protein n=1 Tax=Bergeyella anatis TaxID=3113737 RepID=UPI002E172165|nr:DUF4846 domain-containing protein [Bergeyella sp. RCAD1439]